MMAYARLEPFGPLREDQRAGQIVATIANVNRNPKSDPFHPKDFFPELGDRKSAEPVLLKDPKKQADLIRRMFGFAPRKKTHG